MRVPRFLSMVYNFFKISISAMFREKHPKNKDSLSLRGFALQDQLNDSLVDVTNSLGGDLCMLGIHDNSDTNHLY